MADGTIAEVIALVRSLHDKLDEHVQDETQRMAQLEQIIDRLTTAFPNDDLDGHRNYHASKVKQAALDEEFAATIKREVGKWAILGVLGFIMASMFYYVKVHVLKVPG